MNLNELKSTISELVNETFESMYEQTNPPVKVVVSTMGGTKILMYKDGNEESGSDAFVATTTPFASLVKSRNTDPSKLMKADRDAVEILNLLDDDDIAQLMDKTSITTTNIPAEILNKHSSTSSNSDLSESNKKQLVKLIKQMVAEEFKGEPNHAAEVESDELTSHLSEDNSEDIKDLEKLLANPDPSRAKDYGSIEKYKTMLKQKIDRLKSKKSVDEAMLNKAKAIAKQKTRCC